MKCIVHVHEVCPLVDCGISREDLNNYGTGVA